jgi:hypothetical protein
MGFKTLERRFLRLGNSVGAGYQELHDWISGFSEHFEVLSLQGIILLRTFRNHLIKLNIVLVE